MTVPPAPDGELPGPNAERSPPPRRHCRHCRHCGSVVAWAAVVCLTCGCEPSSGVQHCWFCAGTTRADLHVCPGCSAGLMHRPIARPTVGQPPPTPTYPFLTTPPIGRQGPRSAVVAGVLAILLLTGAFDTNVDGARLQR